jgi:Na+/proline symporter/signal transduction histidine kinase/ActR/RegA family two-component response regulator
MNLDLLIVSIYIAATMWVAFSFYNKMYSIKDYALGGMNFSTAALASTIIATWIGTGSFVIGISNAYVDGGIGILSGVGSCICLFIMGYSIAPRMGEFSGKISVAEVMGDLYGRHVRIIASITGIIVALGAISMQIKILSAFVSEFGKVSQFSSIILSSAIVIIYCTFGGIRAVVFTDVVQFITFAIAIVAVLIGIWIKVDFHHNPEMITKTWLHAFNTTPISKIDYVTLFIYSLIPGMNPAMFQRILMGRNMQQVNFAFRIASFAYLIFLLICSFIGIVLFTHDSSVNSNDILGFIMKEFSYSGLTGIAIVAILAMGMSTADSHLNAASVIFTHDLLRPWGFFKTEESALKAVKVFTVLTGVAATIIPFYFQDLLSMMLMSRNFYMPIVTVPLLLAIFGFRSTTTPALIGMASGFTTVIIWKSHQALYPGILAHDSLIPATLANLFFFVSSHYLLGSSGGWIDTKGNLDLELANRDRSAFWASVRGDVRGFWESTFGWGYGYIKFHNFSYMLLGALIISSSLIVTLSSPTLLIIHGVGACQIIACIIGGLLFTNHLWSRFASEALLEKIAALSLIFAVYNASLFSMLSSFHPTAMMGLLLNVIAVTFFVKGFSAVLFITFAGGAAYFYAHLAWQIPPLDYTISFAITYAAFICIFILLSFVNRYRDELEAVLKSEAHLLHLTEMLNAEVLLRERSVKRAMNMQRSIIQNVNHEIKTPMSALLTNSEMLLYHLQENPHSLSHEQIVEIAAAMNVSVERFIRYAGTMLDLSDYQNDKMMFDIKPNNLRILLENLAKQHPNILLKYNKDMPDILEFDEVKIIRLFDELIHNANKFSNDGPIEISVLEKHFMRFNNKDWEAVRISVRDYGVGIPIDETWKLFEPLYVSSRTKRSDGGMGLGLTMVQEIMNGHLGEAIAMSNLDRGATFHIDLPIIHPKSDFLAGGVSAEAEVAQKIDLGKMIKDMKKVENKFGDRKPKVLMIEDEKSVLTSGEMMVNAMGYEFNGIIYGSDAVEYIMSDEFDADIVLLDMMLPDTTGFHVMEQVHLKLASKKVPVIVQSGLSEQDANIQKTLKLGAREFMGKPYSRKIFQSAINRALGLE